MSRNLDNRFAENRIDFTGHDRRRAVCPAGRSRLPRSAPAASQRRSLAILIKLTAKLSAPPDTVLLRGHVLSLWRVFCAGPSEQATPIESRTGVDFYDVLSTVNGQRVV